MVAGDGGKHGGGLNNMSNMKTGLLAGGAAAIGLAAGALLTGGGRRRRKTYWKDGYEYEKLLQII